MSAASQHKTSQSFEAGFTMKRNATRDFNYLQRVRDIVKWMDMCAGTTATQRLEQYGEEVFLGFFNIIRDGVLLCQAINGARPGTISKIYTEGTIQPGRRYTFKAMQNIQFFLHAGLKLGATVLPFSPMDLFERTNEFNMLDFIWNVKETVELAPGQFLLGQGPGARGRGKGSMKLPSKPVINLPSINDVHEKEDQEERDKRDKNLVVSLRSKAKQQHAALDMNMFTPDGAPADDPSPRSTPVTSPSHSTATSPSPTTSPPPTETTIATANHQLDDELDLKIEVEAEEKLKKAHEEAAKILPVLYVDGTAEEQDTAITLADIRVTYPGCYLKEFQGTGVYRNGGFVLENGKGYELIRPTTHDKLTEEEAADVKSTHHDDDHDSHFHDHDHNSTHGHSDDHLYDHDGGHSGHSGGGGGAHHHETPSPSTTPSPPLSPSASPMVSPAPTQRSAVTGSASAPARSGSPLHSVSASTATATSTSTAPLASSASASAIETHSHAHGGAAASNHTNHSTTTTAAVESRTKTPPHSHPPATATTATATTVSPPQATATAHANASTNSASAPPPASGTHTKEEHSHTSPPPPATIGHSAVPPVAHKDPSTHSDGSHSLSTIFAVPHAPDKDHKQTTSDNDDSQEHDEDDEHDHDHDHEPTAEDARLSALSQIEEQYNSAGDGSKKNYASLRAKRQVGMGKAKVFKGSMRGPGKSISDDSPQSSPDITHGSLKKQPSSPALQAPVRLSAKGGGVRFSESGHSPPVQSATLGGSRSKPHNYAYDQPSRKDKKRQQALRKRIRVAASWEANEILPGLWLGDKCDSMERSAMKEKGITNVFTVACDLPPPFPNDFEYKVLDLLDSSSQNIIQYFPDAIRYILDNTSKGRQTLVHCQQGVSRSATVVIAYVMYSQRMDFDTAGEHVCSRRNRVCPNFGFMQQLKQWGETLQREWAAEAVAKAQGQPIPTSIVFSNTTLAPETQTLNVPIAASSLSVSVNVSHSSSPAEPSSPTHGLSSSSSPAVNSLTSMFITPKHSESVSTHAHKPIEKNNHSPDDNGGESIQVHIIPPSQDKSVPVS